MKRFLFSLLLFTLLSPLYADELTGYASWYGGKFQGRQTANGEIFDTYKLTAAHKTLPFNTVVEVTNLTTMKSVQVRINDRGPFIEGRIIDLSKAAADKIDMIGSGTAPVELKIVSMPAPPEVMDIQVAAFSNMLYAARLKKRLKEEGFDPKAQLTNSGITRIVLEDVPISDSFKVVRKLEKMGFDHVLIKHKG